jgi:hypothetical protein
LGFSPYGVNRWPAEGSIGGLVTWQYSFAGHSNRPTQNNLVAQPFLIYNLPQGVYLRSTASWTFDLVRNNYVIPIGAGVGKVLVQSDGTTINVFARAAAGPSLMRVQVSRRFKLLPPLTFSFRSKGNLKS